MRRARSDDGYRLKAYNLARRCLACRAQRGPLGVLPKAKRPRGALEYRIYFGLNMRQLQPARASGLSSTSSGLRAQCSLLTHDFRRSCTCIRDDHRPSTATKRQCSSDLWGARHNVITLTRALRARKHLAWLGEQRETT